MTANRIIALMVDRSGFQHTLHRPKSLLHHPQLFVLEGNLLGRIAGIGSQHPFAVKALLGFHLLFIDAEDRSLCLLFQVLPVPLVPHQRLVALFQFLLRRLHDCLAIGSIHPFSPDLD